MEGAHALSPPMASHRHNLPTHSEQFEAPGFHTPGPSPATRTSAASSRVPACLGCTLSSLARPARRGQPLQAWRLPAGRQAARCAAGTARARLTSAGSCTAVPACPVRSCAGEAGAAGRHLCWWATLPVMDAPDLAEENYDVAAGCTCGTSTSTRARSRRTTTTRCGTRSSSFSCMSPSTRCAAAGACCWSAAVGGLHDGRLQLTPQQARLRCSSCAAASCADTHVRLAAAASAAPCSVACRERLALTMHPSCSA